MIQLDRVKRQYGPRVLFEGLSWRIPARARIGLVGPNGVGKTTLMRMLVGVEPPDDGDVHKPRSCSIGFLPQEVETVERGSVLAVVLSGFEEVAALERRLEQLESRLSGLESGDPETDRLTVEYGELRHRFEDLEGDRIEARAKAILSGLGIPGERFHEPIDRLSGGWRMRVVLARLLLGTPALLLLDEPTNHLDLDAIAWLEEFLQTYEGAFVVVSHDRYFLNRMVSEIVELEHGKLTHYHGNYDGYLQERQVREEKLEQAARQQAREIAKVQRFIERFRYKNTKARQVQSRIRALDKLERVQTARGTRSVRFGFPAAPRSGDIVVRAEGATKRFGTTRVYDGMDLLLRRGDRVALVGPNGAGKSTLLKLLAGRLQVDRGVLELGHGVLAHYYAQHQLDDLDPASTVLEEIDRAAPADEPARLRKLLGCFLFSGDDVDKRVQVLSGGEKARLALAKMLVRPFNLLLLDEPTNHLDLRSREMLEEALNEYDGTMIVISHDRYFINRVATSIAAVGDGRIEVHEGDYDTYVDWTRRRIEELPPADGEVPDLRPAARRADRESRRREAEERNRRYRERRSVQQRLEPIESEIAKLEERQRELEALQAEPEVYSDPQRAAQAGRDRADVEQRLQRLYGEWEQLAATLPES